MCFFDKELFIAYQMAQKYKVKYKATDYFDRYKSIKYQLYSQYISNIAVKSIENLYVYSAQQTCIRVKMNVILS